MRITITIGNQQFQATLDDSAASRDLLAQLPATLRMDDHAGVEKTGTLPTPLSLEGQPAGADPDVGDVGYYAPGNNLVLYYGDMILHDYNFSEKPCVSAGGGGALSGRCAVRPSPRAFWAKGRTQ